MKWSTIRRRFSRHVQSRGHLNAPRGFEPLEGRRLLTGSVNFALYLTPATVQEGFTVNQEIGAFSDSVADLPTSYSATINWGDGTRTAGTVNPHDGLYYVTGAHTYNSPGTYDVVMKFYDGPVGGSNTGYAFSVGGPLTVTPINDDPIAANDTLGDFYEDQGPYAISAASLLANDLAGPRGESDEDAQTLTITAVSNVVGGTATLSSGFVVFTPTTDYSGDAHFSYTVRDNGSDNTTPNPKSASANVIFKIREVNDAPTAGSDALASIPEDSPSFVIALSDLIGNDSAGPANESSQKLRVTAVANAVGGTAAVQGVSVRFTPAADFNGIASFNYTITDDGRTAAADDPKSATATAFFQVTPVNDVPVAANDSLTATTGAAPRTIPVALLTSNDLAGPPNENNQTLSIVGVSNVIGGTIAMTDTNLIFTPAPGFDGTAGFTYTVIDNGITGSLPDPKTATAGVQFDIALPPTVISAAYQFDATEPTVQVVVGANLNVDITGVTIVLDSATPSQTITPVTVAYDAGAHRITAQYQGGDHILPDGRYHLLISPTALSNRRGETLNAPYRYDFNVLAGDANQDGKVDFNDLVILAQNYNLSGKTFSQGNFNYSTDGKVDFDDLVILAQRYNTALTQLAAIATAPTALPRTTRAKRPAIEG